MFSGLTKIIFNFSWLNSPLKEYFFALIVIVISGFLCFPISPAIGYQTVGLIFLMITAGLSLFLGRGPVLFAALLNFASWNFFFIPPLFTFHVSNFHDGITLFANLFVAIVAGTLIHRIRKNQISLKKSQEDTSKLYSLLEALNNTTSIKDVVKKARNELIVQFGLDTIIYLKKIEGTGLDPKTFGMENPGNSDDFFIANWVFEKQEIAGRFTEILNHSQLQYFPLIVPRGIIGVAGIKYDSNQSLDNDSFNLLKSFITQIALSIEREINIDIVKRNQIHLESEKLFKTILNSVSHELRTPIAIISAAVSNLTNEKTASNSEIRAQIGEELNIASMRLNLLVENILDMSRIESGLLKLNLQYCDITDLFGIAVQELKNEISQHQLIIEVQDNLPMIIADINLLKQCIINILHNCIVYTPAFTKISFSTSMNSHNHTISLEISDNGPGVPNETLNQLFNKFYRIPGSKSGGTGLGLTIAKAIIEAHGGSIIARKAVKKGLSILIELPMN